MDSGKAILILLFGTLFIIQTVVLIKSKKLLSAGLLIVLQGLCALLSVNLLGTFINVHIPLNFWTVCFSGFFGITGVIILLFINILFLTR